MSRFSQQQDRYAEDRVLEANALGHRAVVIEEAQHAFGSSRLPASAGPRSMQDRTHPEAHVAWADGLVASPAHGEMGGPYPQERGGEQEHRQAVVHPIWPARAPRTLTLRTMELARRLDRCLNTYQLGKRAA